MDRLDRLETKVDKVQDDISELRSDFKLHLKVIEEHVAGDKKIINEIQPIIEQFKFDQEQKTRRYRTLKIIGTISAIFAAIATGIAKLLSLQ